MRTFATARFTDCLSLIFLSRSFGVTAAAFFQQYPDMLPFILHHLRSQLSALSTAHSQSATLLPLLLILSKCRPASRSPIYDSSARGASLSLGSLIETVRHFAAHPIYTVRFTAAKALVSLWPVSDAEAEVERVLRQFQDVALHDTATDMAEGLLLQASGLLRQHARAAGLATGLHWHVLSALRSDCDDRWIVSVHSTRAAAKEDSAMSTKSTNLIQSIVDISLSFLEQNGIFLRLFRNVVLCSSVDSFPIPAAMHAVPKPVCRFVLLELLQICSMALFLWRRLSAFTEASNQEHRLMQFCLAVSP